MTSAAICTGKSETSKRVIRRTPLRPSRSAVQNADRPMPLGLTQPIPVMTARRRPRGSHRMAPILPQLPTPPSPCRLKCTPL